MSLEQIQQNYADATGFVVDRTVNPPKVLGQAFLISKSRAVTCATVVFNYTEAPWALALHFPHPDILLGIKSIALHNDFDKKAARGWYLQQTGNPGEQLVLPNDMASLVLDATLPELQQDRVAELSRALSLPFSSSGVEASGNIRGAEFLSVLNGILQAGRTGLLTLFDSRNIPLARIQVAPGHIQKVYFRGLLGELAFFELVYRKPAEGYAFQTESGFNWGNVRDISAPTDALVQEAMRRVEDLPQLITYLGGPEARYQQRIENFDPTNASENIQWFAERLWNAIDGYTTLDKLAERAGADAYTTLQAMREFVNKGYVSMINRATPFHCNGVLGQPLVSHTDFEVNAWDPLQAFYLDPVSGRPTWMAGNFFGVANALQPKNMLHTIALPTGVPGALILKDYKLIGIHGGPHQPRPGQAVPPVKVHQMMWMGALLDMSTKKLRGAEEGEPGEAGGLSGLRSKATEASEQAPPSTEELKKFVCQNCYTTNTQVGPCFNCGTLIEAPPEEPEPSTKKELVSRKIQKQMQKHGVTKQQLMIGLSCFGALMLIPLFCSGSPQTQQTTDTTTSTSGSSDSPETKKDSVKAVKIANENAGFKATAIPGYVYEDTTDITKPSMSFGLTSEQSNQRCLFIIFDDLAPVNNLQNFVALPPYCEVYRNDELKEAKVDENWQLLGDGNLHWFVARYLRTKPTEKGEKKEAILIGAYPAPVPGKSVLVIGRALNPDIPYDYKTTLWLCDQMASDYTARGNKRRQDEGKNSVVPDTGPEENTTKPTKTLASDKDIDDFMKKIGDQIQAKVKLPEDAADELKNKHIKALKCIFTVGIADDDGSVKKLEITEPAELDSMNNAVQKAITACSPFADPPRTKEGMLTILIKATADKIKVELP